MRRHHAPRLISGLLALGLAAAPVLTSMPAHADPNDYVGPIFGITSSAGGSLLVADAGQGIVESDGAASLLAAIPGVTDVAEATGGGLWALTGGVPGPSTLYRVDGDGDVEEFADLFGFEEKRNPHPAEIDSNAFDVADLGGGQALVADAGGNDLLKVNKHGKVKLVAVLPDELVSTENVKGLAGCPDPNPEFAFVCELPPMLPAEPVATSVAIGPDGAYYVGELKGFPAPTDASRVWRIAPNARNADCARSPLCAVAFEGFTSVIDLAFGPDGRLYVAQIDDASWAAVEFGLGGLGGSVHACDLEARSCEEVVSGVPILTSIAFRSDDSLWGAIWALVPGLADVVELTP